MYFLNCITDIFNHVIDISESFKGVSNKRYLNNDNYLRIINDIII